MTSWLQLLWNTFRCCGSSGPLQHLTHYMIHYMTSVSSTSAVWSALPSKCLRISTLSPLLMPPWSKWSKSPSFIIISFYRVSHFSLFSISVHFPSQSKSRSLTITCRSLHDLPRLHPIPLWPHLIPLFLLTLRSSHWSLCLSLNTPGQLPPWSFALALSCS